MVENHKILSSLKRKNKDSNSKMKIETNKKEAVTPEIEIKATKETIVEIEIEIPTEIAK